MAFQGDSIFWVEVEKIVANPYQPRREFDEAKLKELSESVRMYGILQPLTVTRKEVPNEDGSFRTEYELIAGERRLRASKLANISQVPVIIREGEQNEQEKLELAIIENLQREDLNAVDRALAFRQLADVFDLSHSQVAKKVGRSREYVSNSIRILALPDYMLDSLRLGDISEGHARTLLMLNDRPEEQDTVFRETMLKKLSVREVERIARGIATDRVRKKETIDSDLLDLEKQFTETLGTRVSIVKTEFGGRLTIDYFSPDELQVMLTKMRDEALAEQPSATPEEAVALLAASTPLQAASSPETKESASSVSVTSEPTATSPSADTEPTTSDSIPDNTVLATVPTVNETEITHTPSSQSTPDSAERSMTESTSTKETASDAMSASHQKEETALESASSRVIEPHVPERSAAAHATDTAPAHSVPEPVEAPAATQPDPEPASAPATTPTPVAPTHQPAPAPKSNNSLRDQLASMLQKPVSSTSAASSPTTNPSVHSTTTTTPAQPVEQNAARPAQTAEQSPTSNSKPAAPASDEDDTDLYSIKNFTV